MTDIPADIRPIHTIRTLAPALVGPPYGNPGRNRSNITHTFQESHAREAFPMGGSVAGPERLQHACITFLALNGGVPERLNLGRVTDVE